MLDPLQFGRPFHGEFSSADASDLDEATARFTLYPAGGTGAITLGGGEQVVILGASVSADAVAMQVAVYDGANNNADAGELVLNAYVAARGTVTFQGAHRCQPGTYPKVRGWATGDIRATCHGFIVRNGP